MLFFIESDWINGGDEMKPVGINEIYEEGCDDIVIVLEHMIICEVHEDISTE